MVAGSTFRSATAASSRVSLAATNARRAAIQRSIVAVNNGEFTINLGLAPVLRQFTFQPRDEPHGGRLVLHSCPVVVDCQENAEIAAACAAALAVGARGNSDCQGVEQVQEIAPAASGVCCGRMFVALAIGSSTLVAGVRAGVKVDASPRPAHLIYAKYAKVN